MDENRIEDWENIYLMNEKEENLNNDKEIRSMREWTKNSSYLIVEADRAKMAEIIEG